MNFNKTTSFIMALMILAPILTSGCATMQSQEESESKPVPTLPRPQPFNQIDSKNAQVDEGENAGEDDSELEASDWEAEEELTQGFCSDDIYGQYLMNQYKIQNPDRMQTTRHKVVQKVGRGKKSRKKVTFYKKNAGEYEALLFASQRMNGKTDSYFGAIPVHVNEEVYYWVHYFKTSGRKMFLKWLMRGEALRQSVQPVLQDHGIPIEFFYLAMIESGFNHGARSTAKAEGTWQFMKGTAKLYGLKINRQIDERRDPIKSTIAAATYLKDLYADLGDWYLAMAAYNAGPGRIKGAMRRSGLQDYWALAATPYMPHETKQYVPKLLAALLIATDAKNHGFEVIPNQQDFLPEAEVLVKNPVRLKDLAAKLGISVQSIKRWNPELIGTSTPRVTDAPGYSLRLPALYAVAWNDVEPELQRVSSIDLDREGKTHTVRKGETLSRIARRYSISIQDLKAANPGLIPQRLRPGKVINIPLGAGPDMAIEDSTQSDGRAG